jgi:glycosyltransferase involved in cell wall biosynthesis
MKVAMVIDHPEWAHAFKTQNLIRCLPEIDFDVIHDRDVEYNLNDVYGRMAAADLTVIHYIDYMLRRPVFMDVCEQVKDKVILGACSWNDAKRMAEFDVDSYSVAQFANSMELLHKSGAQWYLPNGVDTKFFRPNIQARDRKFFDIGFAGNRTDNKGLPIIEDAVALLSDVKLHVATPDSVKGALTHKEMVGFYQKLDAYVCASGTEGTPNPMLEASACGLPIITTNVGVVPEFIEDFRNGIIVERTPEAIAGAIKFVQWNTEAARDMGQMARLAAEAWDWGAMAIAWKSMFEELA